MAKDVVSVKDLFDLFNRFFKVFLKKWYFVLLSILVFVTIGIIVSNIYGIKYKAKLTFVVQESQSPQSSLGSLGALAGMASQFGIGSVGASTAFNEENIGEVIKSKNIICKALLTENDINGKKDFLINYYLRFNDYYKEWKHNKVLSDLSYSTSDYSQLTRLQDSVLNKVYKEINAKVLDVDKLKQGLDIILIKVQSKDEAFSKIFTENLIKGISEFYTNTKTQRAAETFAFLQRMADSTKTVLENKELELAKWQDARNQLVKFEGQVDRAKLMREVDILNVVYSEVLKNLAISKMNLLNIKPLIKIIDYPVLPLDINMIPVRFAVILGIIAGIIVAALILFIRMILLEALHKDDQLITED